MRPEPSAQLASGRRLHAGSFQRAYCKAARPAACSVAKQVPYSLVGRRLAAAGAAALLTVCMAKGALQKSTAKLSAQQDARHGEVLHQIFGGLPEAIVRHMTSAPQGGLRCQKPTSGSVI
jgi:hypothetical protein